MYEKQLFFHEWLEELGQPIHDKMKLQEDILINVKLNKIVGYTKDFICKNKIEKSCLMRMRLVISVTRQSVTINGSIDQSMGGTSIARFW